MVLKVKLMNKLVICFFLLSQMAFAQKSVKVCGYYVCAFDKKEIVSFYENKLRQLEGKSFSQIKDIEESFVVSDNMEIGHGNKIPLWLFGLLY